MENLKIIKNDLLSRILMIIWFNENVLRAIITDEMITDK